VTTPRTETGTIINVTVLTLGSELAAAYSSGAAVLSVLDASDYDTNAGGTVAINGVLYAYTVTDADNGVLSVSPGLSAAGAQGDRVDVWDLVAGVAAVEYRANVAVPGEIDNVDSVDARIAAALVPQFTYKPGIRDPGTGESCVLQLLAGEWVVTDTVGGLVQTDGAVTVPASIPAAALSFGGNWVAYTPTMTATGTNPANWTCAGYYTQIGKTVLFEITATASSTFTAGSGAYIWTLPTAHALGTSIVPVGVGAITNSEYNYIAIIDQQSAPNGVCLYRAGVNPPVREGSGGPYGNAWGAGNIVRITGSYRAP
jgi:hypothetical protein